jgi:citronellyl-CoA dehydrogenase
MMSILVDTDMATPIIDEIGTKQQKEEFLAPIIRGEYIAALGVTEPGAGSDVANIRTTARRDGDDYVINGSKTYITNGAIADVITLAVRTGGEGHAIEPAGKQVAAYQHAPPEQSQPAIAQPSS